MNSRCPPSFLRFAADRFHSRACRNPSDHRLLEGSSPLNSREKGCRESRSLRRREEWCRGNGCGYVWAFGVVQSRLTGPEPGESAPYRSEQKIECLLTRLVVGRLIIAARRRELETEFRRSCARVGATRVRKGSDREMRVLVNLPTWSWLAYSRPRSRRRPRCDVLGLEALRRLLFLCCEDGLGCASVKRTHSRAMTPVNAPFPGTVCPSALSWSSTRCAPPRGDEVALRIDVLLRQLSSQSMRRGSL